MVKNKDTNFNLDFQEQLNVLIQTCEQLLVALIPWKTYQPPFLSLDTLKNDDDGFNTKNPNHVHSYHGLNGFGNLEHAIQKELNFLKKLSHYPEEKRKPSLLQSTNVWQWAAIVHTLYTEPGVMAVLKTFSYTPPCPIHVPNRSCSGRRSLKIKCQVDVVSHGGLRWIKLRTRNAKGLHLESCYFSSDDEDKESDIEEIDEYEEEKEDRDLCSLKHQSLSPLFSSYSKIEKKTQTMNPWIPSTHVKEPHNPLHPFCLPKKGSLYVWPYLASHHLLHFQLPQCHLYYTSPELPVSFQREWEQQHWILTPLSLPNHSSFLRSLLHVPSIHPIPPFLPPLTSSVLLDTSTLLALVSELSHTHHVSSKVGRSLQLQYQDELERPLLPCLLPLLKHRTLLVSETGYQRFLSIVNTVAGEKELRRAHSLFSTSSSLNGDGNCCCGSSSSSSSSSGSHSLSLTCLCSEFTLPIQVVPDPSVVSSKFDSIPLSPSHLNSISYKALTTADTLQCTFVTANLSLIRALQYLHVPIHVWVHPPRSLSEQASTHGPHTMVKSKE